MASILARAASAGDGAAEEGTWTELLACDARMAAALALAASICSWMLGLLVVDVGSLERGLLVPLASPASLGSPRFSAIFDALLLSLH